VDDAAPELEQLLARVAVAPVLLDRIIDRLLGKVVLQFEGRDRQPVDEEGQVEGQLGLVAAVAQLASDAEAVRSVSLDRGGIVGRGRGAEEVDVQRPVLDAIAQHVDRPALRDLAFKTGEETTAGRPVLSQGKPFGRIGLRLPQEGRKLGQIHTVLAVVIRRVAAYPARPEAWRALADITGRQHACIAGRAGQGSAHETLEAAFGGIGRHA
jgi:hypothetical protein